MGLLCLGASAVWSDVTIDKPDYSITFGPGWTIVDSGYNLVGNMAGIGGFAMVRSQEDDGKPLDINSEIEALGDSVEANFTVTKEEVKTFGSHETKVVHVKYDTLRRVERELAGKGLPINFRNGASQVYIVRTNGVRVNIIGVNTSPFFTPYSGIEQAIPSLKATATTPVAGPAGQSVPAWFTAGGKLRFAGEQPLALAALDARGRLVARLRKEGGAGNAAWVLPSGTGPFLLTALLQDNRLFPLGWWKKSQ